MKIKNLIWYWFGNELKWLWPFKVWSYFKPGIGIVTSNSRICIEGFPRSGNTFLFAIACQLIDPEKVAHHLHHCAQIAEALRLKVPVFFIVRNPSDAIASYVIREEIPIERAIDQYLSLYHFIEQNSQHIHILSFETLRTDVNAVIRQLIDHMNIPTETTTIDLNTVKDLVADLDRSDQGSKDINPMKVGLPNPQRDALKAEVLTTLRTEHAEKLTECESVYEQIRR